MSRFFSSKYASLTPYTPGEQPKDIQYIKLNTNENPYPPHPEVARAVEKEGNRLYLYSDPECRDLTRAFCEVFPVEENEVLFTNGSDEILNFAFMAFCDESHPAAFADITYGFYPVFASLNGVPYEEIPLKEDFTIDINDYTGINKTIFIANPNAPTGIALKREEIEKIIRSNPDNIVVIDEAYVDFGGESCIELIHKYDNLLVCGTFSKSRSMAGARLGFGIGCSELIRDLNTVKYSTNPYNINRMTSAAGVATLKNNDYTMKNCGEIIRNRAYLTEELEKMGFTVLPSRTNFVFAKNDNIGGEELYLYLKEKGILVRHFTLDRIKDFNRITVGTREQCEKLLAAIEGYGKDN